MYFCCLEAVQNASKHAGAAAAVHITVAERDEWLCFEVRDNGAGFDVDAVPDGAGLTNIRDRVAAVRGHIAIESRPGRGTRISATIPLSHATQREPDYHRTNVMNAADGRSTAGACGLGVPQTAAGVAVARAAGREPERPCVVVAAVATTASADDGALPQAARTLAGAIRGRVDPLTVTRHGEIVLVRVGAREERVALRAPLAEACERAASQGVRLAVAVSTVQQGLSNLSAAHREASQALRRIAGSGGVLSLPDLSAFEFLTLRNDAVARRLIPPEIERFVAEDREHGGQLIDTLLAYAESDLNAKAAAERLLIHVNTAHYRLGRIEEKTGCDLRRLADVIDLLIAVRLADA